MLAQGAYPQSPDSLIIMETSSILQLPGTGRYKQEIHNSPSSQFPSPLFAQSLPLRDKRNNELLEQLPASLDTVRHILRGHMQEQYPPCRVRCTAQRRAEYILAHVAAGISRYLDPEWGAGSLLRLSPHNYQPRPRA